MLHIHILENSVKYTFPLSTMWDPKPGRNKLSQHRHRMNSFHEQGGYLRTHLCLRQIEDTGFLGQFKA